MDTNNMNSGYPNPENQSADFTQAQQDQLNQEAQYQAQPNQEAQYQNQQHQNEQYNDAQYQSGQYQNQQYQAPQYQVPNYSKKPTEIGEVMSLSNWLVMMLLMCIPCANIILLFVWAFDSNQNKNKSNFCKAYLIMLAIWTALVLTFYIIVGFSAAAAIGAFN